MHNYALCNNFIKIFNTNIRNQAPRLIIRTW